MPADCFILNAFLTWLAMRPAPVATTIAAGREHCHILFMAHLDADLFANDMSAKSHVMPIIIKLHFFLLLFIFFFLLDLFMNWLLT